MPGLSIDSSLIRKQLLHYIFELQKQGVAVSSRLAIIKASSLSREFRERVANVQYCSVC